MGASFPGLREVVARWGAHGMVLGIVVVKRVGPLGPLGSVSRPSSPRADLFRLRSQELMAGWLRAFCRSPTFWPSSVVTLSTLRFCEGSEGAKGGETEGPAGAWLWG